MSIQQNPSAVLARATTRRGFMAKLGALLSALLSSEKPEDRAEAARLKETNHSSSWRGSTACKTPGAAGSSQTHRVFDAFNPTVPAFPIRNGIKWRKQQQCWR